MNMLELSLMKLAGKTADNLMENHILKLKKKMIKDNSMEYLFVQLL